MRPFLVNVNPSHNEIRTQRWTDQNRCGNGCGSSTTTPALVYFPSGSYLVSAPIIRKAASIEALTHANKP